ncbi:MAG: alpha/beta hydrolase [Candidatus Aenigmarchaeota archaeon]
MPDHSFEHQMITLDCGTMIHVEYFKPDSAVEGLPFFVFVPGDELNVTVGYHLADFFSKKGHSGMLIDPPDHGLSGQCMRYPDNDYMTAAQAEQSEIINEIVAKYCKDNLLLAGYSSGGFDVLKMAIDNPGKVSSLVLIACAHRDPSDGDKGMVAMFDGLIEENRRQFENNGCVRKLVRFDQMPGRSMDDYIGEGHPVTGPYLARRLYASLSFDEREAIGVIRDSGIRVLAIRGDEDKFIKKHVFDEMVELTDAECENVPGVGHYFPVQKPKLLTEKVEKHYDFLVRNQST